MSLGTLYVKDFPRVFVSKLLIKHFNLDVKIVDAETSEEYAKLFPLKLVPAFVGSDGYVVTEVMAVNAYLASFIKDSAAKNALLGDNVKDQNSIIRWQSTANTDFFMSFASAIYQYVGRYEYHQDSVDRDLATVETASKIFETQLKSQKYLVNNNITLADLFCATLFGFYMSTFVGPEYRTKYPSIARWFKEVSASPILKDFYKDYKYAEKDMEKPAKK